MLVCAAKDGTHGADPDWRQAGDRTELRWNGKGPPFTSHSLKSTRFQWYSEQVSDIASEPPSGNVFSRLGRTLRRQAIEWCQDRSWKIRVPVLIYFLYVLVNHWGNLEYSSLLGSLNFAIHEGGHVLFSPFGEFMMTAGGTILQCLAPMFAMAMFYKTQKDFFGIAFCFGWLSTNFFHCGTYAADARGQLNLVLYSFGGQSFGADGVGDWSVMLGKLGMLEWDTTISWSFRAAGTVSMLVCFALAIWLMWIMARSPEKA